CYIMTVALREAEAFGGAGMYPENYTMQRG
ncbi:hypothetical protein HMPREF9161_01886, partial [Selenomonas sp. F0473]